MFMTLEESATLEHGCYERCYFGSFIKVPSTPLASVRASMIPPPAAEAPPRR
jgi:hypothetical protein